MQDAERCGIYTFAEMSRLRIGINARLWIPGKMEGIGRFTQETLSRMIPAHPEVEFHLYFDRTPPVEASFENARLHRVMPPARRTWLFDWWFNRSIPGKLKKHRIDLFLSTDGFLSMKTEVPQLPVMHDLNFEHHPEWLPENIAAYYRSRFPAFAMKAERIATVSEFSKQDISKTYGIPEHKIDVVYNGVGEDFKLIADAEKAKAKERWSKGRSYFIFVGSLHPRKNLEGLVSAFERYRESGGKNDLVIVGASMWKESSGLSVSLTDEVLSSIHQVGRLESEALNMALASAEALIFIPLFEGFGIPIIEAFKCETPVICSNVTSLPEVAGDAALLVNPRDHQAVADIMLELELNEALQKALIAKAKERAKEFTWEQSATLMWESIKRTGIC